jgi:predicted SnoaL-like aldol condensation-catalyzing enzyme
MQVIFYFYLQNKSNKNYTMRQIMIILLTVSTLTACDAPKPKETKSETSKKTPMNKKEIALAFVNAVTSQDEETVCQLVNSDYIQHNPFLPTGLDPFIGLFPVLKENGTKAKAIRVIEDGNFVAVHHLWTGAKPFGAEEMVSFDILRFDDKGKIAEHWDAMMPNTPPNPAGRTLIDGPTEVSDLNATAQNKALVSNLLDDILYGKNPDKITEYISTEYYHQHNPQIADNLDGLQKAFQFLIENNNMFQYQKLHKVIGEGNFVLTINEGEWSGKKQVFYDLFRIENGKAVEHWDIIQEIPTEGLANNNGMFGF